MPDAESNLNCNLCGGDVFGPFNGRPGVRCVGCGSLERTRLLWMYLEMLELPARASILHIAPEPVIGRKLIERLPQCAYTRADIDTQRYASGGPCTYIDLCDLDGWPSASYDLILHVHVLEHTPCNIAYTLYHLHRMLKPSGRHVLGVPFLSGQYDESFQPLSDQEKKTRFAQWDHVRRFGRRDIGRHIGALLRLPEKINLTDLFQASALRQANIPQKSWDTFDMNTILNLGRYDMKLSEGFWYA